MVDAFPDVTNVQVQIATEAPGRSPEEVERFVTVPLEIAMTGLPGLTEMRSLNRNALSVITLVFTDDTDVFFARQLVMERLDRGCRADAGRRHTRSGRRVDRPRRHSPSTRWTSHGDGDRALTEQELTERRTIQDWVVRPMLRGVSGVAEITSRAGFVKQYQVLANLDRLIHYGLSVQDLYTALARNNANSGGGILPHYSEQYLIRGVGLIRSLQDIERIVLKEVDGTPVFVRDVAKVTFGTEVRQGAMIKNGYTESAGGIVLMLRGGNAKDVVTRVKAKVNEINRASSCRTVCRSCPSTIVPSWSTPPSGP